MDPLEALTTNAQLYWTRLDDSQRCCETDPGLTGSVHIIDVPVAAHVQPGNNTPLRTHECTNLKVLDEFLSAPENSKYSSRVISISQNDSWSKLQITKPMLRKIITHHGVDASFLEVPLSFYARMNNEEQSFCVPWTGKADASSIQMFYTFRYAEYVGRREGPWVIRQMGVYQKFDIKNKRSLYILVNATPDSAAYSRVLESCSNHQQQMQSSPLWLHSVIHASYFMRWREYISEYESRLLPIATTTTAAFIDKPLRVNHDTLGKVRSLENRFIPLRAIFVSFEEVLEGLEAAGEVLSTRRCVERSEQQQFVTRLENLRRYARTFTRTSLYLQQRSNNTATLLADTLAFRNQNVAQEQNKSMLILTRSAVFITVITLIYLPWTLVTGIFGMEFFEMNVETRRIVTSPQIWIYFATAAGASIITVVLYWLLAGFPRFQKTSEGGRHEREDNPIPRPQSMQRACTDIEKNPKAVGS